MPRGVPNKRYTAEFKKRVVETMLEEGLSYSETERKFDLPSKRPAVWERIYLEDGPEGFTIERRRHSRTKRSGKLTKAVEEDLAAEVQRLGAENEYLNNLQALALEDEQRRQKKTQVVIKLRQKHKLEILLSVTPLSRATFYYHLKRMKKQDKYAQAKEEITAIYHKNKGRYR